MGSPHMKSMNKGNKSSAYVEGLRLTILQIHMYQYLKVDRLLGLIYRPNVDNGQIIIIIKQKLSPLFEKKYLKKDW